MASELIATSADWLAKITPLTQPHYPHRCAGRGCAICRWVICRHFPWIQMPDGWRFRVSVAA